MPRQVDLGFLTSVAVKVNYYQMQKVVEVFSELWVADLMESIPVVIGPELFAWLDISCVFRLPDPFKELTQLAL